MKVRFAIVLACFGLAASAAGTQGQTTMPQSDSPAPACDGAVTFRDQDDNVVTIARCRDPLTDALTNTITVRHRNGKTETRTVTTTPSDEGGFSIDETTVDASGNVSQSSRRVGGGLGRGGRGLGSGRSGGRAGGPGSMGRQGGSPPSHGAN